MEKEKVLEIEITKINDNWSVWDIKKINRKILKNGINDKFCINDNNYHFEITEGDTDFYYTVNLSLQEAPVLNLNCRDEEIIPNLIENNQVNDLVLIITEINKKYGIIKRWRGQRSDKYFTIFGDGEFGETVDNYFPEDQRRYEWGNYFKTEEEAQKVKIELDKFWERVRNGEMNYES